MTDALWAPVRDGHDKSEIQQIQIELLEPHTKTEGLISIPVIPPPFLYVRSDSLRQIHDKMI